MERRQFLGCQGEELVAQYLCAHGFKVCARNYRQRGGEIDIVARKDEVLAFVEVKLRDQTYFSLSELITPSKQRKIVKTALRYLNERAVSLSDVAVRFDVALVERSFAEQAAVACNSVTSCGAEGASSDYTVTYIPNAFCHEIDVF